MSPSPSGNGAASEPTQELRSLMSCTLQGILKALDCGSGSILLYDPRTDDLCISEMVGPKARELNGGRRGISGGIAGWVASKRDALLVEDVTKDPRFTELRNSSRAYRSNSFISSPLLDGDKLIGVVNVCEKSSGSPFTADDLATLQTHACKITESVRSGMAFRELSDKSLSLSAKVEEAARQLVQANFELAQMQSFHDNILRSISLGLVTFDRSLRVTYFNEAAGEIFGFTDADINLASLLKLKIETRGTRTWQDVLEECVADGKASTLQQMHYVSPSGREVLLDLTCAPLGAASEEGGTLVAEDVGRTLQIERRLAQAEQHATIGKLAASVAHELNNPLDGVLRFTNLALQQKDAHPKTADYLHECRKGLERMSKIVRQLLDYSRTIGKGLEDQDINELIASSLRNLRPLQIKSNVTVKTNYSSIPRARFPNFSEVFSNIIRNAYQAMPAGGQLTITTEMLASSVVITFADTGAGIPQEIKGKIFEPFFTTKNTSECTGLGLTICSDIVSKYGGTIDVQSTNGHGATFSVRVPL